MNTFWLADEPFERTVQVDLTRREHAALDPSSDRAGVGSATAGDSDGLPERSADSLQHDTIAQATWTQRGHVHYVMYAVDAETRDAEVGRTATAAGAQRAAGTAGAARAASRIIWKLERAQVTMIRHGAIRWSLGFHPDHPTTSTAFIGNAPLPVHITTLHLAVNVAPRQGSVGLTWNANLGGTLQSVTLDLRFSL